MNEDIYDVLIVGAGVAGLSAATVLGRAHRSVLLVDNGKQSNLISKEAHAVFTRDKTPPSDLYKIANEQLHNYKTVHPVSGVIKKIKKNGNIFEVTIEKLGTFMSKSVLLSQGMNYTPLDIMGMRDIFGNEAWHCPYCEGYEANGKKVLAIYELASQEHMKKLLPIWIEDLHFKTPNEVISVIKKHDGIHAQIDDGSVEIYDEIAVQTFMTQRDDIHRQLKCTLTETGRIQVDPFGHTSSLGVFSAGDQASDMSQINLAVSSGHIAGIGLNMFLS